MATFKSVIFLRDKKRDGTVNVKIRVTHNRKTRYLPTPFYVTSEQMTRGGKLKDPYIEGKVQSRIKELKHRAESIGFAADEMDIDKFMHILNNTGDEADFIKYCRDKIKQICNTPGREGTAAKYKYALGCLIEFNGSEVLPFSKMTKRYVNQFYNYMIDTRGISIRTANNYTGVLSSLYNSARRELNDEEMDIIVVKYSCFQQLERKKPDEHKFLAFKTVEEMQRVIDTKYFGLKSYDFIKDMFIFSFVCYGMNLKDILRLKKDQVDDGLLTYSRRKVERRMGSRAEIQIKLSDVAKAIIEKYKTNDEYLIKYDGNRMITVDCSHIHKTFVRAGVGNGDLKGEHYTFNSARHSMATFLINVCRVDRSVVHQMLVHSNVDKMAITDWYIRRDYSILWEANEKLLALFDWSNYLKNLSGNPEHVEKPQRQTKTRQNEQNK